MELGRGRSALLSRIITVAETGSTNADLLELARSGVEEGLWLRADLQTSGRGRQGRSWVSPAGNLYASTLVRLRPTDPPAATLALVAAVALWEVLHAFLSQFDSQRSGAQLQIKWPNDLMLNGAKLSGILLERAEDAVVIGMGVNLAHHPELPERLTTSLADVGVTVGPHDLLAELVPAISRWMQRWRSEGMAAVQRQWLAAAHPAGSALSAHLPDGTTQQGTFGGLDVDGALRLCLADGTMRLIHAGDVFLV